jgi:hypothetical protein
MADLGVAVGCMELRQAALAVVMVADVVVHIENGKMECHLRILLHVPRILGVGLQEVSYGLWHWWPTRRPSFHRHLGIRLCLPLNCFGWL